MEQQFENEVGVEEVVDSEILRELYNLENLTPGTEEHGDAVDTLVKLLKARNEAIKVRTEYDNGYFQRELDEKFHKDEVSIKQQDVNNKEKEFKLNTLKEFLHISVDCVRIIVPIAFYAKWLQMGLKFEETGSFTSTTFRGLLQNFKPTTK